MAMRLSVPISTRLALMVSFAVLTITLFPVLMRIGKPISSSVPSDCKRVTFPRCLMWRPPKGGARLTCSVL